MQPKTILLLLTSLIATAAAAPSTPEVVPVAAEAGGLEARASKSWTAKGGCKTDWRNRCNAQCIGEGVKSHGCKASDVRSGIESSHCFIGWNICHCQC